MVRTLQINLFEDEDATKICGIRKDLKLGRYATLDTNSVYTGHCDKNFVRIYFSIDDSIPEETVHEVMTKYDKGDTLDYSILKEPPPTATSSPT